MSECLKSAIYLVASRMFCNSGCPWWSSSPIISTGLLHAGRATGGWWDPRDKQKEHH